MIWDGVTYFGFNTSKLKRLEGHKPGWCDKFKDRTYLLPALFTLGIVAYLLIHELVKFGSVIQNDSKIIYFKNFEF